MPQSWTISELVVSTSLVTDSAATVDLRSNLILIGAKTTGDQDVILRFQESDANHDFYLDDGNDRLHTPGNLSCGGTFASSGKLTAIGNIAVTATIEFTNASSLIDPETSGRGTLRLGNSGDADIILLDTAELHTTSTTYDSTATLANGVYLTLLDQAASQDTLNLPAVASHTNRMVIIKCINANGSVVDGNSSELIDGSQTQALAQWDSITIYCNGTAWYII